MVLIVWDGRKPISDHTTHKGTCYTYDLLTYSERHAEEEDIFPLKSSKVESAQYNRLSDLSSDVYTADSRLKCA